MSASLATGLRTFHAVFQAPVEVRRLGQDIWFEGLVTAEDIAAAEIARLTAVGHLRLAYALRSGPSTAPAVQSGQATLHFSQEGALRYRVVLQPSALQMTGLLQLGFFYEGLSSFEDWGIPGTWAVVSISKGDPFQSYFANFNTDQL